MGFETDIPSQLDNRIDTDAVPFKSPRAIIEDFSFIKTLIKTPPKAEYVNSFKPRWTKSEIISDQLPENRLFLISREKVTLDDDSSMYDYISVEEEEIVIKTVGVTPDLSSKTLSISYGPKETERLFSLYANAVPQLQVTLDEDPLGATATTTNSVKGDGLTFNSLSSLGPISQETLTLNVVSDLEGQIIEQREAVVTDVGGVTTTGTRESLRVDRDLRRRARDAGITSGTTTITSGY